MKGRLFLLVREGGLALRCGAGRLGLQASPGGLLSALGFKSPDTKRKMTARRRSFPFWCARGDLNPHVRSGH